MNPDALLAEADRVVEKAIGRGADQAEVWRESTSTAEVEFERGQVTGADEGHDAGFGLRVVKNGRLGFAYWSASAPDAIDRALQLAAHGDARGFELEPLTPATRIDTWDADVVALDAPALRATAAQAIQDVLSAAPEAAVSGGVHATLAAEAVASSEGAQAAHRVAYHDVQLALTLPDGESAVSLWDTVSSASVIDPVGFGAELGRRALGLRGADAARSGTADLVLLPNAASEMVLGPVLSATSGDRAARGRSVWSGRLGEEVAHSGLSVRSDPKQAILGRTGHDGEGRPCERVDVLRGGVLEAFIFDTWDARRHGQAANAATRGDYRGPPGAGLPHVELRHEMQVDLDELVGGVDHGYLVESVLGAHTANATTGDFSVTAANVMRIEGGALVGPASELAIAGNMPRLLQHADGTAAPKRAPGRTVPAIRIRDVAVAA